MVDPDTSSAKIFRRAADRFTRIEPGDASLTNAFAYISPFAPSGLRAPEQTTLDECGARLQPAPFVGGGPQVLEHA
ncbi:MAG TPA: hypothetical protein VF266_28060 [Thermoanaerobaculia bacterium]